MDDQETKNTDPLAQWLERQFANVRKGTRVCQIALMHLNLHDVGELMEAFDVPVLSPEAALDWAGRLRVFARIDAEGRGGRERYALRAHWPSDAGLEPSFVNFSVDGTAVRRTDLTGSSEPATDAGLLKQLMRHNETLMKVATQQTVDIQDENRRREERANKRIAELEEGRFKVVELAEAMLSARADRDNETLRLQAAEKRKDAALAEFMGIIPVLKPKMLEAGAKLMGINLDAGGPSPEAMMLRSMFEGMTMEQMRAMQAQIPPDKQVLFIETYKRVMNIPTKKPEPEAVADAAAEPTPKH